MRLLLPLASLLLILAGCGGGHDSPTKPVPPSDGLPAGTPAADSPDHLVQRLEKTWEFGVESQYSLLLSEDFRYHFSADADPKLADMYGENWTRVDEIAALTHLFHGFTRSGVPIPAANRIDMTLTGVSIANDPDHADSTAHYRKCVIALLDMQLDIPGPSGDPYPTTYVVSSRHELYLVRGDAAVVPSGSPADSSHWYMRRWDDLAAGFPSKFPVINPAAAVTLGKIRADYR